MPWEEIFNFILELLKLYGPAALGIIILLGCVWYLMQRNNKDRAECRDDFRAQHAAHRKDRNEWVALLQKQNETIISAFTENSKALAENTNASDKLAIHIQNCQKP